jgi:hypothetical protein
VVLDMPELLPETFNSSISYGVASEFESRTHFLLFARSFNSRTPIPKALGIGNPGANPGRVF